MRTKLILCALALVIAKPALAHHRHHHHNQKHHSHNHHYLHRHHRHVTHLPEGYYGGGNVARRYADGRPRAWCGWYARHFLVGSDPGPSYNLAMNWRHWGHDAGGPRIGAMIVWWHHIGKIVGRTANGMWIILSGNDGHAVRTRPRSIAGAIAFRI